MKEIYRLIKKNNNGELITFLKKLGRLPENFDKKSLLNLTHNKNPLIRTLSIKNLAKLRDISLLKTYKDILKSDESSKVRRETISAIGRLRNKKMIPELIKLLKDFDPEVVMQTIRALLIFKKENKVKKELIKLKDHPNEIIKEIIKTEFGKEHKKEKIMGHPESLDSLKNTVIEGDVRKITKCIPNEAIHLTFTSPPYYNARDYSIYKSYKQYLKFLEKVFKEVYRITKEGRFFLLNTSPIIIPRVSRKYSSKRYPIPYDLHGILTKIGWEFIDDIIWIKPEASVKNRNAGFLQHRKPPAYKPNARTECIMVYRKKTDKLIDWNIKQYSKKIVDGSRIKGKYETSNVWEIDPVFDKTHSAVFPMELCNKVIKYYSFVGDLVFDPFAGSGTFGKSAIGLNRYFFLTEINEQYIKRIEENLSLKGLFLKNYKKPTFLNLKELKNSVENDLNTFGKSS